MYTDNTMQIPINKLFEISHCYKKGKVVPYMSWKYRDGVEAYLHSVSISGQMEASV
jgi:hypothetical protein